MESLAGTDALPFQLQKSSQKSMNPCWNTPKQILNRSFYMFLDRILKSPSVFGCSALLGLSKPSYLPEARSLWDERWLRTYILLGVSRIFPTKCFLEACGYVRIRLVQDLQDSIALKCDHLTHRSRGMSGLAYTACNYLGTTFLHFLLGGLCCICTAVCGLKFALFWQEPRVGEQSFSSLLVNCQTAKVLKLAMPSRQLEINVFEGSETCGEGVCSCGRSWGVWDQ